MSSYKGLIVWQKAMGVAEQIYLLTKKMPKEEQYGITNQMRRAAVSIPSNIAEGYERHTDPEYKRFLSIAKGSASELETQLLLCERIELLETNDIKNVLELLTEIEKMLYVMIRKIGNNRN